MIRPWHALARPEQRPPDGDWTAYLVTAGRGWGKTRAAAEWVAEQAATLPNTEWAVIAPTWRACRKICFEGGSGILQALLPDELNSFEASDLSVRLTNGSKIYGYSAGRPDRFRSARFAGVWIDEFVSCDDPGLILIESLVGAPRLFITTGLPDPDDDKGVDRFRLLENLASHDWVIHKGAVYA